MEYTTYILSNRHCQWTLESVQSRLGGVWGSRKRIQVLVSDARWLSGLDCARSRACDSHTTDSGRQREQVQDHFHHRFGRGHWGGKPERGGNDCGWDVSGVRWGHHHFNGIGSGYWHRILLGQTWSEDHSSREFSHYIDWLHCTKQTSGQRGMYISVG